jgi:hypothetical protein
MTSNGALDFTINLTTLMSCHFPRLYIKLRHKTLFINSVSEANRSLNHRPSVTHLTRIIISGSALDDNFAINPLHRHVSDDQEDCFL